MKVKALANKSQIANVSLELPAELVASFTYLDCGAQGDRSHPLLSMFPNSRYIGFDPQQTTPPDTGGSSISFPVAIGRKTETISFYRTRNPNCSSFLKPDAKSLAHFQQLDEFLEVAEILPLDVVALDEYLTAQGIPEVDFMELDTQGSELDILEGAKGLLASSVLGVRVEVEFFPIYERQPLFAEVDAYLRQFGFMLFDLDRYHLRRKSSPPGIDSREQILWGQALYFRDFLALPVDVNAAKQRLSKLAMVASYFGFHGYALDIVHDLVEKPDLLTAVEKQRLQECSAQYVARLQSDPVLERMQALDRSLFHKVFRRWGEAFARWYEAYRFITSRQKYFWKD